MSDRKREREIDREKVRERETERAREKERTGMRSVDQNIVYNYHYAIVFIHDLIDNLTITATIIFKIKNV